MNDDTLNLSGRQLGLFRKRLLKWYRLHHRELPWRETDRPYNIWVSEVMLQQTQVVTVIDYYNRFIERFPDVGSLARADLQDVLKLWEGLGYYARARNLHRAAREIVSAHAGRIPDNPTALKQLPGVGDYIGAAVSSIAFGHPSAVVDGNVKRVLARLFVINEPVNVTTHARIFSQRADALLCHADPGMFNQAMMELGAMCCHIKTPSCVECPVNTHCRSFQLDVVADHPKRIKRSATPTYHVTVGVIHKGNKVLITKRKSEGLLGGLWEFPGGKIERGETPEDACKREIKEEVNLEVAIASHMTTVRHAYSHFKIVMDVFDCTYMAGRVKLGSPVDFEWVRPGQLASYPFPRANTKFIPLIMRMHQGDT